MMGEKQKTCAGLLIDSRSARDCRPISNWGKIYLKGLKNIIFMNIIFMHLVRSGWKEGRKDCNWFPCREIHLREDWDKASGSILKLGIVIRCCNLFSCPKNGRSPWYTTMRKVQVGERGKSGEWVSHKGRYRITLGQLVFCLIPYLPGGWASSGEAGLGEEYQ